MSLFVFAVYGIEPGSRLDSTFAQSEEPVWLLGIKYSTLHELEELMSDFQSRLWMTYRTGFTPIGGSGPTSDSGWGCMLRCGQMVLAQALMQKHLGRDWRWTQSLNKLTDEERAQQRVTPQQISDHSTYMQILSLFEDKKNATYSIHQIAQMGASEGKPVGTWFGPNTIAQAMKYDSLAPLPATVTNRLQSTGNWQCTIAGISL